MRIRLVYMRPWGGDVLGRCPVDRVLASHAQDLMSDRSSHVRSWVQCSAVVRRQRWGLQGLLAVSVAEEVRARFRETPPVFGLYRTHVVLVVKELHQTIRISVNQITLQASPETL